MDAACKPPWMGSRRVSESSRTASMRVFMQRSISRHDGKLTAGELAKNVSLSQATITDIVKRLEQRGLMTRERANADKRRILIKPTAKGRDVIRKSPPLLQEKFSQRFVELKDREQTQLLSALQRIATMMDAEDVDASPVLTSGSIVASEVEVAKVLDPKKR
jgi:DNA-binding MarR family transcriptional regulator